MERLKRGEKEYERGDDRERERRIVKAEEEDKANIERPLRRGTVGKGREGGGGKGGCMRRC